MSLADRRRAFRWGHWAERLCALHLRLRGYRVIARRLPTPAGEIDLVARRGGTLALIEVKARPDETAAAESITARQQRRILDAARWFLAGRNDLAALSIRFDAMLVTPWRWPRHVTDAWRPDA